MSSPRLSYRPRPGVTSESEITVLSDVYAFILRCGEARRAEEMKKGTRPGAFLYSSDLDEKEKGGRHVEHLTNSSSGVDD